MERLRIVIEFKKTDMNDIKLFSRLISFSAPGAVIKDILKGNIPLSVLEDESERSIKNE